MSKVKATTFAKIQEAIAKGYRVFLETTGECVSDIPGRSYVVRADGRLVCEYYIEIPDPKEFDFFDAMRALMGGKADYARHNNSKIEMQDGSPKWVTAASGHAMTPSSYVCLTLSQVGMKFHLYKDGKPITE